MKTEQTHKCGSCLFYDALSKECSCMQGFPTDQFDDACEKYLACDRHSDRTRRQDKSFTRKPMIDMSRH